MREYHSIWERREQPAVLCASLEDADARLRELAQGYANQIERVILTGCGDPYLLGIAAAHGFERWARVPADAVEATVFTFYRSRLVNECTFVVLITSSGKTVKVIDATRLAVQHGVQLQPSPISCRAPSPTRLHALPTKQTTTASPTCLLPDD